LESGQEVEVDLELQTVKLPSGEVIAGLFSKVQMEIYRRGGLLNR
jgi:hypothetical protein